MHKKRLLKFGAAPLAALAIAAPVYASTHARTVTEGAQEAHILGLPSGYSQINMRTCKFATREVDVRPTATEAYARAEDLRHDALDNCLRRRLNNQKTTNPTPKPDPCWAQAGPPPAVVEKADHGAGKPGDELGAAALSAWETTLWTCETNRNAA